MVRNLIHRINNRLGAGVRVIDTKHVKLIVWTQMRAARFGAECFKSDNHRGYSVTWADPEVHRWWATSILLEIWWRRS
jgi:hypothetical protein